MTASQMEAFDRLPKPVRVMLRDLKFNFNARDVLTLHEMGYSTDAIRRRLLLIEEEKHRKDAETGAIAP